MGSGLRQRGLPYIGIFPMSQSRQQMQSTAVTLFALLPSDIKGANDCFGS